MVKEGTSVIELMTEQQVAEALQVKVTFLRRQRTMRMGIPFVKLGPGPQAQVRYRKSDILAYLNKNLRVPPASRR